jgi:thiol-disulfide isomerase/thioredoxin
MMANMLNRAFAALALGLLLFAQPLTGQERTAPASPATPSSCLANTRSFLTARMKEVPPPMTSEKYQALQQEKVEFARACIARISLASLPAGQFAPLAELYIEASQLELADKAIERALDATAGDSARRAAALVTATRLVMRQPKSDERNAKAETYVDALDTLSESFAREKIEGHGLLNGYYRADDIDAGILKHSTKIIELGQRLTPEQRTPVVRTIVAAYVNAAEAYAGQEQTPKALDLLRTALKDLGSVEGVDAQVRPTLERYELVGKPAAAVEAPQWLQATPASGRLEMPGKVTLLEFTAHWCGPCRQSYPGIVRLANTFGPKGFRVVMATQLWGYFESQRNLSPADELKAVGEYFPKHGIAFPIAVGNRVSGQAGARDVNDANYKVGGIPQIQIIDKKGVIRLIMVGYDQANEARLSALIARLLAE